MARSSYSAAAVKADIDAEVERYARSCSKKELINRARTLRREWEQQLSVHRKLVREVRGSRRMVKSIKRDMVVAERAASAFGPPQRRPTFQSRRQEKQHQTREDKQVSKEEEEEEEEEERYLQRLDVTAEDLLALLVEECDDDGLTAGCTRPVEVVALGIPIKEGSEHDNNKDEEEEEEEEEGDSLSTRSARSRCSVTEVEAAAAGAATLVQDEAGGQLTLGFCASPYHVGGFSRNELINRIIAPSVSSLSAIGVDEGDEGKKLDSEIEVYFTSTDDENLIRDICARFAERPSPSTVFLSKSIIENCLGPRFVSDDRFTARVRHRAYRLLRASYLNDPLKLSRERNIPLHAAELILERAHLFQRPADRRGDKRKSRKRANE